MNSERVKGLRRAPQTGRFAKQICSPVTCTTNKKHRFERCFSLCSVYGLQSFFFARAAFIFLSGWIFTIATTIAANTISPMIW